MFSPILNKKDPDPPFVPSQMYHPPFPSHPSARASRVLQRPSGASIPAEVSMLTVEGSRVSNAAQRQ